MVIITPLTAEEQYVPEVNVIDCDTADPPVRLAITHDDDDDGGGDEDAIYVSLPILRRILQFLCKEGIFQCTMLSRIRI